MKLGLVYRDDASAPVRPLSPYVFQVCRPDFVSLEVASLDAVKARVDQVAALRLVANYVIPVERLSRTTAAAIARVLSDLAPAGHLRRITIGAEPSTITANEYLTKIARLAGEFGATRITLGLGAPPPAWRRELVDLVHRASVLHSSISGVQVGDYPTGPTSWRQARKLVAGVRLALPGAAVHVETGWRTEMPLGRREAWRTLIGAWTSSSGAPLSWAPWARPMTVTSRVRDVWIRDAWDAWSAAGAASLAVFGHIENAGVMGATWNVLSPALRASSSWSELRNLTTAVERARTVPGLTTTTDGARLRS